MNPCFVEALMGFPDNWTRAVIRELGRDATRNERLQMLGNSVVPQCAEVVGHVLMGLDRQGVCERVSRSEQHPRARPDRDHSADRALNGQTGLQRPARGCGGNAEVRRGNQASRNGVVGGLERD